MNVPLEYATAGATALFGAISYLVKELVARQSANDKEKAERLSLHQAHIADLKDQLASQKEALDRYQDHVEKSSQAALIQERASMTVILAMGDKIATHTTQVQQTLSTFMSLHAQK